MSDEDLFVSEEDDDNAQENQYLLCNLGNEEYGISISDVQSIEELQTIVAVPDMPPYVKGVINLRGRVLPVIDMRIKLEMQTREYDDRTCIVIVRIQDSDVGLVVDTVSEVVDIQKKDIDPAPSFQEAGKEQRYISGIGKMGDEVKILLDVSQLLHQTEIEETKLRSKITEEEGEKDGRK